jgi:hypothetical protein
MYSNSAMAYRLFVSYLPTMKPMPFDLPALDDAPFKVKIAFERGYRVEYIKLDGGSVLL